VKAVGTLTLGADIKPLSLEEALETEAFEVHPDLQSQSLDPYDWWPPEVAYFFFFPRIEDRVHIGSDEARDLGLQHKRSEPGHFLRSHAVLSNLSVFTRPLKSIKCEIDDPNTMFLGPWSELRPDVATNPNGLTVLDTFLVGASCELPFRGRFILTLPGRERRTRSWHGPALRRPPTRQSARGQLFSISACSSLIQLSQILSFVYCHGD
jgi:hypothetical protein